MNFVYRMPYLLCCFRCDLTLKGTDSNKSNLLIYWWVISRNYMLCITLARLACCCCLSHKFWIGLDYDTTPLVDCLFSRDDFDCSVIHIWGTNKSKVVIGEVTVPANLARTPSRKWELNSNWPNAGKECGSILSSHLWGGTLRDDTKNGCVAG